MITKESIVDHVHSNCITIEQGNIQVIFSGCSYHGATEKEIIDQIWEDYKPYIPNYKYGDIVIVAEGDPVVEAALEGDMSFPQIGHKFVVKVVKLSEDGYVTTVVDCATGRRYQEFESNWFVKDTE